MTIKWPTGLNPTGPVLIIATNLYKAALAEELLTGDVDTYIASPRALDRTRGLHVDHVLIEQGLETNRDIMENVMPCLVTHNNPNDRIGLIEWTSLDEN